MKKEIKWFKWFYKEVVPPFNLFIKLLNYKKRLHRASFENISFNFVNSLKGHLAQLVSAPRS